jgi:hypothetical protein
MLSPKKAPDFKAEESIFLDLVRAVDIDVDGSSNLYVCDWRDGRFKFAGKGKKVGMLQKIVKKGLKAPPLPKFAKLSNAQLVALHKDPSAVRRLEAQRELLSRKDFKDVEGLIAVVGDKKNSKASRVAAIFTIAQLKDDKVIENLKACGLAAPNLGEFVLRALGDRKGRLDKVSPETFSKLLGSSSPRLQLQAVIGLMRLGQRASGSSEALINLATVTNDERIKHTCIQALVAIAEIDVLLKNTDHAVALQGNSASSQSRRHFLPYRSTSYQQKQDSAFWCPRSSLPQGRAVGFEILVGDSPRRPRSIFFRRRME